MQKVPPEVGLKNQHFATQKSNKIMF